MLSLSHLVSCHCVWAGLPELICSLSSAYQKTNKNNSIHQTLLSCSSVHHVTSLFLNTEHLPACPSAVSFFNCQVISVRNIYIPQIVGCYDVCPLDEHYLWIIHCCLLILYIVTYMNKIHSTGEPVWVYIAVVYRVVL